MNLELFIDSGLESVIVPQSYLTTLKMYYHITVKQGIIHLAVCEKLNLRNCENTFAECTSMFSAYVCSWWYSVTENTHKFLSYFSAVQLAVKYMHSPVV